MLLFKFGCLSANFVVFWQLLFLLIEKHELFECTSEIQLRRYMTLEKTNMIQKDLVSITSSNVALR